MCYILSSEEHYEHLSNTVKLCTHADAALAQLNINTVFLNLSDMCSNSLVPVIELKSESPHTAGSVRRSNRKFLHITHTDNKKGGYPPKIINHLVPTVLVKRVCSNRKKKIYEKKIEHKIFKI